MPCREHLAQLRKHQEAFTALGATVVVVTFEPPGEKLTRFVRAAGIPFPVLSDPDRAAYAAFSLGRGARGDLWTWQTAGVYLRGLVRGESPRRPRGDTAQLGGDFVIDAAGRVVFAHRGATPADRPAVDALLDALRRSEGAGHS